MNPGVVNRGRMFGGIIERAVLNCLLVEQFGVLLTMGLELEVVLEERFG